MSGRSAQDKRKRDKHSVDMTQVPGPSPAWSPPPADECEPAEQYTITPPGGVESEDRVKLRLITHTQSSMTAEFAVVQQTYRNSAWRDVAAADSCHDGEVHLHRYSRSADARVGEPEHLCAVSSLEDLAGGYDQAYEVVVADWQANKRRWHDA